MSGYSIFLKLFSNFSVLDDFSGDPWYLQYLKILNTLRLWLKWIPSFVDFQFYETMKALVRFFFQLQLFSTWDGRVGVFGRNCTMYIPCISWKLNINRLRYSQIDFIVWGFLEFLKHTEAVPCCEQLLQRNVSLLRLKTHGLWRYKLSCLHHYTMRIAYILVPANTKHVHV